ncbi:MAG: hypothetical protein ABI670_00965, partial [Chloroflexota bacterium]
VKHAASVCPEPGSNSPNKNFTEICHTDFNLVPLEELTWFSVFLTTLQLLMCLSAKEDRRTFVPPAMQHRKLDWLSRLSGLCCSLAPFCFCFGSDFSDLDYYTARQEQCQGKMGLSFS